MDRVNKSQTFQLGVSVEYHEVEQELIEFVPKVQQLIPA